MKEHLCPTSLQAPRSFLTFYIHPADRKLFVEVTADVQSSEEDYYMEAIILVKHRGKSEKVVILKGITSIVTSMFDCCQVLANFYIADDVTSIGYRSSWKCEALTNVDYP